jgi:hypothetical protein
MTVSFTVALRDPTMGVGEGVAVARVKVFFESRSGSKPHPTEVECGWSIVNAPGERLLQLSTYGSEQRQSHPKVSQTIQLDEEAAARLVALVLQTFPGLRS